MLKSKFNEDFKRSLMLNKNISYSLQFVSTYVCIEDYIFTKNIKLIVFRRAWRRIYSYILGYILVYCLLFEYFSNWSNNVLELFIYFTIYIYIYIYVCVCVCVCVCVWLK